MLGGRIDRIEQRWSGVTAGLMTACLTLTGAFRRRQRGFDHPRRPTGHGQDTLAMNIAEFVAGEANPGRRVLAGDADIAVDRPIRFRRLAGCRCKS